MRVAVFKMLLQEGRRYGEAEHRAQSTLGPVKILCVILKWWTHAIMLLSKPMECTPPRMNHNANYGFR